VALREMRRDPRVFVMGEEVGLYDGAYKVTQGLLKEFGDQHILPPKLTTSAEIRVTSHLGSGRGLACGRRAG